MLGSVYLFLGGCGGGVGWCLKGEGHITFSGVWGRVKIINSAVFGEGHIKNIQSDSTFGLSSHFRPKNCFCFNHFEDIGPIYLDEVPEAVSVRLLGLGRISSRLSQHAKCLGPQG